MRTCVFVSCCLFHHTEIVDKSQTRTTMMDSVESERLDGELNVIRLETPTDEQQNNADVVSLEEVDLASTTQAADPIDRKGKLMAWYHSHSSTLGIIWLGLAFCIMFTAFSITQVRCLLVYHLTDQSVFIPVVSHTHITVLHYRIEEGGWIL